MIYLLLLSNFRKRLLEEGQGHSPQVRGQDLVLDQEATVLKAELVQLAGLFGQDLTMDRELKGEELTGGDEGKKRRIGEIRV